jgi:CheY-like chemotaxis protein/sulfur transfer complex TusBCD TusB component (DsrH family)
MVAAPIRILVADDSRSARASVVSVLMDLPGVSVFEVENGAQALKEACDGGYGLLITDIEMPVMTGLQLLRMLRSQFFSASELPVIVLTKADEASQRTRALSDGANDYVTKPVDHKELVARVQAQLDLKRLHRDLEAARALAAHAQAVASLSQLAAVIAHELNTPAQYLFDNIAFLQGAFGKLERAVAAGLARPGDGSAELNYLRGEIPPCLDDLRSGVEAVSSLVRAIREFADVGTQAVCTVDVRRAIESVVQLSRARWLGVADVVTRYDDGVRAMRCHPADIKHAVWHLLVQATDELAARGTTKRGQIEVLVSQHREFIEIKVRRETLQPTREDDQSMGDTRTREALRLIRAMVEERNAGEFTREASTDGWTTAVIRLPSVPPGAP